MKERIIEILGKIGRPKDLDDINSPAFWIEDAADEIIKVFEFEALCNPDLYEAHMNELVIDQNYVPREDYEHAVGHIGELQAEINYLRGQIETRDFNDKYRW